MCIRDSCIGGIVETFGLLVQVSRIVGVGYETEEVVKTKGELDGRDYNNWFVGSIVEDGQYPFFSR